MFILRIAIIIVLTLGTNSEINENVRIYANKNAPHGQPHTIIVTLDSINNRSFECDIRSPNNLIDLFRTNVSNPLQPFDWRKSIDLPTTLKFYGITPEGPLDYAEGWFYRTKTTFWTFGAVLLSVKVYERKRGRRYKAKTHSTMVYVDILSVFSECVPKLIIAGCAPLEEGGRRFNFAKPLAFQSGYLESCGDFNINMPYHWTVYDYLGREELQNLGYTKSPSWKFEKYYFSPSYVVNPITAFQIRVTSKIDGVDMRATCYMKPRRFNVIANILGDTTRQIPYGATFLIDGRKSRDPWLPPNKPQQLLFKWECRPIAKVYNKECDRVSRFRGPVIRMKNPTLRGSFAFILTVISKYDSNRNATNVQFVDIKDSESKELHMECIENCAHEEFVPAKPIVIAVSCMNCNENKKQSYKWYANNDKTPISTKKLLNYKPTSNIATLDLTVTLEVRDDSHSNRLTKSESVIHMRRSDGPLVGKCAASPGSGIEMKTTFTIDCNGFESKQQPLRYCVMIDEMPVGHCSENPQVEILLPFTTSANMMVCDQMELCVVKSFKVIVARNEDPVEHFDEDLSETLSRNFRGNFMHGDMAHVFQICYNLARTVNTSLDVEELTYVMEAFKPHTIEQFQQLLLFARRFMWRIHPLDSEDAYLFSKIFRVITTSFEGFVEDQSMDNIHISLFIKIVDVLLNMVNSLMEPAEIIQNAQCRNFHGECVGFDDLTIENYQQLQTFDPTVSIRVDHWMHLFWEIQKCLFFLGSVSFKRVKATAEKQYIYSFTNFDLEQHFFELSKNQINITTRDQKHTVIISPKLAKELRVRLASKEILLQLVIQKEGSLHWWHPEVTAPSTKGIAISIYSAKRMINETEQLSEPLAFISQMTDLNREPSRDGRLRRRRQVVRSTEAPPESDMPDDYDNFKDIERMASSEYVMTGKLDAPYQAQVFRTEIFSDAVLAIKFLTASIDLFVTMTVYEPTSILNLREYSCPLKAQRAYNTTFLMVNLCNRSMEAFIMVQSTLDDNDWDGMHGNIIEYSFELESRSCYDWTYDRPEPTWRTAACFPHLNATLEQGMHCYCSFLSTFMTKVIPIKAMPMPGTGSGGQLAADNRLYVIIFYVVLNVGLLVLLWILKSHVVDRDTLWPLVPEDHTTEIDGRGGIMVQLFLGGRQKFGATANIHLSFYSKMGEYNFIVYQMKNKNRLKTNEAITLRLDSQYVSLPTLVAISHDGFGRYPNFFLRNITVRDIENQITQKFSIYSWIQRRKKRYIASKNYTGNTAYLTERSKWCKLFREVMEFHFTNWFLLQPVIGPWRHGIHNDALNLYERSCIWTCKFAITFCIVACAFGRSTMHACELTKKTFSEPEFVVPLAFISYLISCVVQSLLTGLVKRQHTYDIERM